MACVDLTNVVSILTKKFTKKNDKKPTNTWRLYSKF